ncbi:hypothetical protein [Streptomyces goshikiensis]|uniref:hypothetical protein n=1 Tax=Streptomyces goshikiensis TaxID=1942 RepID=UPI0036821565
MIPGWRISRAPALAANEASGALSILMRGATGPLWVSDYNGSSWRDTSSPISGAAPHSAPAAAYFNNKLYVMYARIA